MKDPPVGWPRISASLFYEDAPKAIDFLCRAFGFELLFKVEGEGGRIEHSELRLGKDGLLMVSTAGRQKTEAPGATASFKSPVAVGGANTQSLAVFVDDVEAHCEHAKAAGARIVEPPKTSDYGDDYWTDCSYRVEDLEGHTWWFMQRLRDQKPRAR